MRASPLSLILFFTLVFSPISISSSLAASQACDESCLSDTYNNFLNALLLHDPSQTPLAENIKASENGQWIEPGDGLWRTISGLGDYQHLVFDTQTNQIAAYQSIVENGLRALLSVRLKIENNKIIQSELLVVRSQDMSNFLNAIPAPVSDTFDIPLEAGTKLSRQEMIDITNGYFDAILAGDGSVGSFDSGCTRFENGIQTAGSSANGGAPAGMLSLGCEEQMNTGGLSYITDIQPRRYLLVDQDQGFVFAVVMFVHSGQVEQVPEVGSEAAERMSGTSRPFNVQVAELFKIVDGKLIEIEAVMTTLPYKMNNIWDGIDET